MNYLVLPVGSHGDVHPLLGIAIGLRDRGHRVTMAVNTHFESLVRAVGGIEFMPLGTDEELREALANPDLWHPTKGFKAVMDRAVLPFMPQMYDTITRNFSPADTVLVAAAIAFGARVAQERHGYRMATTMLQPAGLRTAYDVPKLPGAWWYPHWLPPWGKRILWSFADRVVVDPLLKGPLNEFRAKVGLSQPIPHGVLDQWWYSPDLMLGLFPDWFAPPQPDWPKQTRLTGFPLYDERGVTAIDPSLAEFISTLSKPPIAFTPGSANLHGADFFAESTRACQMLDRAGLLLTRHADQIPQKLPPTVRHVPYAPFSELLPHCSALIHHGGIGTTAQALRAACPQLIMPLSHDQPDNAHRIRKLGVGDVLPPKKYRAAAAAQKLAALVDSPAVKNAARAVAGKFAGADGIARACEEIERLAVSRG